MPETRAAQYRSGSRRHHEFELGSEAPASHIGKVWSLRQQRTEAKRTRYFPGALCFPNLAMQSNPTSSCCAPFCAPFFAQTGQQSAGVVPHRRRGSKLFGDRALEGDDLKPTITSSTKLRPTCQRQRVWHGVLVE